MEFAPRGWLDDWLLFARDEHEVPEIIELWEEYLRKVGVDT